MFQKKFLTTFAALFLSLAGLFLLYHSNINETVFLDIAADNPIRVSADDQEEGIAVDENNDGSFTVSLPSTFLYQTKTVYFQNTGNEAVQLKFYSRQKKDGDKVIKFSIDVKKIEMNGKSYNSKRRTAWFERPYVVSVPAGKEQGLSLTVQYKTKFMLRNVYIPEFMIGIAALLFSITALFVCWREKIEAVFICRKKFAEKSFQKYLINNYEWDTVIIKKYHAIDGVYRKTFWTVFIILNLVFLYSIVNFYWGNHDWGYVRYGLWGQAPWASGRFANFWLNQLLGGRLLPVINFSFALFGFSFTGILLAFYWNVQKTFFNLLVVSLVIVLNPLIIYWQYFSVDFISHLWLPSIVILALILSEKKSIWYFLLSFVLLIIGLGIYGPVINTIGVVLGCKILLTYCFEKQSIRFCYEKFKMTFFCILIGLISFKFIIDFLKWQGLIRDAYNVPKISLESIIQNFLIVIKQCFQVLLCSYPFYDNTVVQLLLGIGLFSFITVWVYKKKYDVIKITQLCVFAVGLFLLVISLNLSNIVSGRSAYDARIIFYGNIFLFPFFIVMIIKTHFVWAKNILLIFLIILLPSNVFRILDSQKLGKMEFDRENRMMERIAERIEESPNFKITQDYTVIFIGDYPSQILPFYKENVDLLDGSFITFPSFVYWSVTDFLRFHRPMFKIDKGIAINNNIPIPVDMLLPLYNILKNKLKEWPMLDSVLVEDNYIVINLNQQTLERVVKILEENNPEIE